jgi:hypothetical protein
MSIRFGRFAAFFLAPFLAAAPAAGYKFPGDAPSPGGALAAAAIGKLCPGTLAPAEIEELNAYLARDAAEQQKIDEERKTKDPAYKPFPSEYFRKLLFQDYEKKYSDAANCTADAAEEAGDMLRRVRKTMASAAPLHPSGGEPGIGEVVIAKVTAAKCPGVLEAPAIEQLGQFIARYWERFAQSATKEDTADTQQHIARAEADMTAGWKDADCKGQAITRARDIAGRLSGGGGAR